MLKIALMTFALAVSSASASGQVYATYGTHNSPSASPCAVSGCIYKRAKGEPADPLWPVYWQSDWTMYRVFQRYQEFPPPYAGKPPAALRDGVDYQTSHGASFYDSTWVGVSGKGAMEERYDSFCLPIFPIENDYSCKFVSLGDVAYFVAGDGRPPWMPPVCLFSPQNHSPGRDFVAHLPYSAADSARIGKSAQAYSFWVSGSDGKVVQTGASPDRTKDHAILFGYGFEADAAGRMMPQSFYFSGYPLAPANAPIVSQNYTDFAASRPDPAIWSELAGLDPHTLPACQLFDPPAQAIATVGTAAPSTSRALKAPTWGTIGRWTP